MKRLYTAFVTIFWLGMMGLLFQKEVLPSIIITNPAGYKIGLSSDYPVRESWMGIYFKGNKIGFSNTVLRQDVEEGVPGYRMDETTLLRLKMQARPVVIKMRGTSFFGQDSNLRSFNYKLSSPDYGLDVSGRVKAGNLNVTINSSSGMPEKIFKLGRNTVISSSISPFLLFKRLGRNKELDFEIFDPVTSGTDTVHIKNTGNEMIEFNGVRYDTEIFEADISGIKTRSWVTEDGDVLREESPLGFVMLKEPPGHASDIKGGISFGTLNVTSDFSVVPGVKIERPRAVSYLKIEKNGSIVEIFKDKKPLKKDIPSIPIEDIPEGDFIQSKDPRILKLAEEIIGDERSSWEASKKVLHWVYDNVRKAPVLSVPSSLDVLRSMQGDCNEHTALFTALTRSQGIPTEMVAGLVYLDGAFHYHAWPKVYAGMWINMDPTLGQEIADATHIPLLEGGLREQVRLVTIMGGLKMRVIDYR